MYIHVATICFTPTWTLGMLSLSCRLGGSALSAAHPHIYVDQVSSVFSQLLIHSSLDTLRVVRRHTHTHKQRDTEAERGGGEGREALYYHHLRAHMLQRAAGW